MKLYMDYFYHSHNGVLGDGAGRYETDGVLNISLAVEKIRQELEQKCPADFVDRFEITPVSVFAMENPIPASSKKSSKRLTR